MTEMGEGWRCAVCLAVVGVLRLTGTTSRQHGNCAELEFEGLPPGEKVIRVEENSYLTFRADVSECEENPGSLLAKVVLKQDRFEIELCKLLLYPMCNVTVSSAVCQCINTDSAQLFMKVNRSESNIYTWKWFFTEDKASERHRDIWILTNATDSNISHTPIIIITTICSGVIVSAVAVYICWKRGRTKDDTDVSSNDQERNSSEFDSVSDDTGNRQHLFPPEDTYDHLSRR